MTDWTPDLSPSSGSPPAEDPLARHGDLIARGRSAEAFRLLEAVEGDAPELADLMRLAARIQEQLRPVPPAPAFRAALHQRLLDAAQDAIREGAAASALQRRARARNVVGGGVALIGLAAAMLWLGRELRPARAGS